MRIVLLFIFVTLPSLVLAAERDAFYGTWGTPKQCARAPIKSGGTLLAKPYEISSGWLRQGDFWCRLDWGRPIEKRENGLFTAANAQCGEDSVRGYFLRMKLSDEKLTLLWDFPVSNGPLNRCAKP
jgi:hypothetical protein